MKLDMSALQGLSNAIDIPIEQLISPLKQAMFVAYLQSKGELPERLPPEFNAGKALGESDLHVNVNFNAGEISIMKPEYNEAGVKVGEFDDTPADFGRIAATITRRIVSEKLNQLTGEKNLDALNERLFTLVSGIVQQGADRRMVYVDLGVLEAVMPPSEQTPGEKFAHGDRIKALLVAVQETDKGAPYVVVSRTHKHLVAELFALEVPEVSQGIVEIKAIAREAGSRSKVAIISHNPQVAAKGACIGPKGARVDAVVKELNGEKIDLIDWSEDPAKFIGEALAPAKALRVDILDLEAKVARVFVADFQQSLAIGREGQNVRLAARLTGWKIDVRSDADPMFAVPFSASTGTVEG